MKQISFWAKGHKWQSRILIILIYIMLNACGIYAGKLLFELNVLLPTFYFSICVIITMILWLGYPANKKYNNRSTGNSYVRRKFIDFSLSLVTFLMIVFAGNHWNNPDIKTGLVFASKLTPVSNDRGIQNHPLIKSFKADLQRKDVTQLTNKDKLRLIKKQVKGIQQNKETSKGEKAVLIILSVLVALVLLFGLTALACNIACSGSEALAILVAVLGSVVIVALLVKVINLINKPKVPKANTITEPVIENK